MADILTKKARSERMSRIRGENTKPELVVRRLLHRLGYRFRLHAKNLPGKPDIVFPSRNKAIYVNGCFWHQHSDPHCKISHLPISRREFWLPKLRQNWERDIENQKKLISLGWNYLVVWECQVLKEIKLIKELKYFLDN